jgi:beta-N-acetylhexosaminidase
MKNCFGHDGSTGTMLWIDKDRKLVFSFLTNRGHPNVGNPKFDAWKPSFADLLLV